MDTEEYVESVLVDVCSKSFKMFSNLGEEQSLTCETTEQFMDVLSVVKYALEDDEANLYYLDPIIV